MIVYILDLYIMVQSYTVVLGIPLEIVLSSPSSFLEIFAPMSTTIRDVTVVIR